MVLSGGQMILLTLLMLAVGLAFDIGAVWAIAALKGAM